MNLLFTCAGRRNYLLNYFRESLGGSGVIVAADMFGSAPAFAAADRQYVVPPIKSEKYIRALLDICQREHINALFSLYDLDLEVLAARRDAFEAIGVQVVVSDSHVVEICIDKRKTADFAWRIGVQTPQTFTTLEAAEEALRTGKCLFPMVVKPRWGLGSIGLEIATNMPELILAHRLIQLKLLRTVLPGATNGEISEAVLIQEKVDGIEYGLDILNDFDRKTAVVYVKEKIAMRAGETDKAVLRNRPDIEAIGFQIGEALGHIGNLDCDVIERDGRVYLLDLNPRFGGGYPFTHLSGGLYTAALVKWLKGESFDISSFKRNYDQMYSKCDILVPVNSDTLI